jgi:hypothetical protein
MQVALARRQGQEICASATDEAKAPTFSVALSLPLITLTFDFCASYSCTTRDPSQSLFYTLHLRLFFTLSYLRYLFFDTGHF